MSALKKAFEVLKPHHSRSSSKDRTSSAQQSDAESGVSKTSTGLSGLSLNGGGSRKHSPGSTPRGSIDRLRQSLDHPRASTMPNDRSHRDSLDSRNHRSSTDRHRPRATHSPLGLLRRKVRGSSSDSRSSTEDLPLNRDGEPVSRGQARKMERQAERERHEKEVEEHNAEQLKRKQEAEAKAAAEETDEQRSKYGVLPVNNYAGAMPGDIRVDLRDLKPDMGGQVVTFRARLHNIRKLSAHLMFVELRQQTVTIQGVLQEHGSVSAHFLYWAEHLHVETIVKITGVVQDVKAKQGIVESTSIKNIEIHIHEMFVEAKPIQSLPFTVHEAEVSKQDVQREGDGRVVISDRARQSGRIIDLRTTAAQSIFRVQSAICQAFRSHLHNNGFIEIHTPKLQAVASESGASVFKVGREDPNFGSLYDLFANLFREPWVIQRFLPKITEGDKRIILIDGEAAGAINRVPAANDIRSNMVRGGAATPTDLTPREREICETIGPDLKRMGLILVGIDVIDGNLTEINVTAPTGVRAIKRLGGPDLAVTVWDVIESKVRR